MRRLISEWAEKMANQGIVGKRARHKKTGLMGTIVWDGHTYDEGLRIRLDVPIGDDRPHPHLERLSYSNGRVIAIGISREEEFEIL